VAVLRLEQSRVASTKLSQDLAASSAAQEGESADVQDRALVRLAASSFANSAERLQAELASASAKTASNTIGSIVSLQRAVRQAGIRNQSFDAAIAALFATASKAAGPRVRIDSSANVLHNLVQDGFGSKSVDSNQYKNAANAATAVMAETAQKLEIRAQAMASELQEASNSTVAIEDRMDEVMHDFVASARHLTLAAWSRCIMERAADKSTMDALERGLQAVFAATRACSEESLGAGAGSPLARLHGQVVDAIGVPTLVQLRQIQLTAEMMGSPLEKRTFHLPPRLRFAVSNAFTAQGSMTQSSVLQHGVLEGMRARQGER